ncbi:MAG: hypothetical protein ACTHNU_17600 [Gaiellales bacterium]
MGSQAQDTEQHLLERIQRLEAAEEARQRVTQTDVIPSVKTDVIQAAAKTDVVRPPAAGPDATRTDLTTQSMSVWARDPYVAQLEERVRYLEGHDRAYRARRTYFLLSAMCFAGAVGAAAVVAIKVRHFVSSEDLFSSPRNLPTALKHYFNAIVIAFALDVLSIAFLIFGLFSRPPRPR